MRKWSGGLTISALFAVLVTQFNNCGTFSESTSNGTVSSSVSCTTDNCITPSIDNLKVTVNFGGSSEFSVPVDMAEFNLGGDCNEGGFPYNTIRWELKLNNVTVRHSGLISADTRCVNGRYSIYVPLTPIGGSDNFNRTGLMTPTGFRAPYDLWIEIFGQSVPGGPGQRNNVHGSARVSLTAI